MAVVERARSTTSSLGPSSRDTSLAAPVHRGADKGNISSSATSVASSDGRGDGATDLMASGDAASETSSHRRKISKLFKGRKSRRKSMQDDTAPGDLHDEVPPVPDVPTIHTPAPLQSEESLALHKSLPSSLLTDDSDADS